MVAVIDVFRGGGRSFLMPPVGVALQPETIIDISHESLIRNWRRLQEWVKDEAESARIYRRLAGAATDYRAGVGGLLDDVTLQFVLRWREKSNPDRAWGARYHPAFDDTMAYLEESRVARDARLTAERERERRELATAHAFAEKQARSASRMRRLTAALFLILLFALGTAAYALHARSDAKQSEKEAKELATRLQAEKTQTEILAAGLEQKKKETEKALVAESNALALQKRALDAQKLETERANEQKRIAAVNLKKAVIAQQQAEENAKEIVEAGKRDDLLRLSIQASRREDPLEALGFLQQLKTKLEALQPGTASGESSPQLTPERVKQFALDLGWTLSDIGAIYQQEKSYQDAIANYEEALGILHKVLPENTDNPILFGTYHGLGHSNYNLARHSKPALPIYQTKAEDFFKRALAFQEEHRANKPSEIAGGHLNLARLYTMSLERSDEAVKEYRLAIGLLRETKPEEADAALRELAQFHRDAGRYSDAAQVYNELITSQEDITIFEFADKGQGIANVYSELADVYRADGKEKEADDVFHVADLIQKVSLKLKRDDSNVELNLDNDLDEMGDGYVKLGKFSDAEVLYKQALEFRTQNPNKTQSVWKSYDRLTRLYRENLQDDQKAEEYNNRLIELLKDSANVSKYVDSMVQLAAVYAKDPTRYSDAETLYTRALDIAMGQDDWQYPNLILYSLGQVYYKQKKVAEREQAVRRRLEVLSGFFKRLADPAGRRPKAPINLVSEYLNAVEAEAFFQSNVRKNDAAAEAAYQSALAAFDYITGNVYNSKVLETYAGTLDHYQTLLNKQNKAVEAARVSDRARGLREKLGQFDKIYSQNNPAQQTQSMTQQTPQ